MQAAGGDLAAQVGDAFDVRQVVSNTADTLTVSTAWARTPVAGDAFRIAGLFPAGAPVLAEEKIANAAPGFSFK